MNWVNYHTHTTFCDGKNTMEENILAAMEQGIVSLGFSSHAPLPFPATWTLNPDRFEEYAATFRSLKQKYQHRINLFLGLEVDYIPDRISPATRFPISDELDYRIGSVHFAGCFEDGTEWPVDGRPEEFEKGYREIFNGDIRKIAAQFYRRIMEMVQDSPPDIVAHFDLIRKNNKQNRYFSEDERWYRPLVIEALETIAESGCVLEVNTGGMARKFVETVYPSPWILKEACRLKIPVILNSDSHRCENLTYKYEETSHILKESGYRDFKSFCPSSMK